MKSKKLAGEKAVEYIQNNTLVRLGTGSTVYYTIVKLAERVKSGLNVKCVSTSSSTTKLAKELGINMVPLHEIEYIDVTIDGADEVDCKLNGIKGGGGALLYEKLVAKASKKVIWVVDSNKKVETLGKFPLPIEVVPFSYKQLYDKFYSLGYNPSIRMLNESYYVTDAQHYIIDLHLDKIENPYVLEKELKMMSGVVDTGLFLDMADTVIIGYEDEDKVKIIER